MVGGTKESVAVVEPAFLTLAPEGGYAHVGPVGRGALREDGAQRDRVRAHAGLRRGLRGHGARPTSSTSTCTRSPPSGATARWCAAGCSSWPSGRCGPGPASTSIKGVVADSGEGRWTAQEAIDRGVSAPVIATSLFTRFASQEPDSFQLKMLSALRNQFGGHAVTLESGQQGLETRDPDPVGDPDAVLTPVDDVPRAFATRSSRRSRRAPGPRFALVLSGGPTAQECYEVLADDAGGIDWTRGRRLRGRRARRAARRRGRQPAADPGGAAGPGRAGRARSRPCRRSAPVDECVAAYQRTMSDLVTGPGIDLIHLGHGARRAHGVAVPGRADARCGARACWCWRPRTRTGSTRTRGSP